MFTRTLTALTVAALSATVAHGAAHLTKPANTVKFEGETYLADASKMTLYTFDKDKRNVSNCYGDCAAKWPPVLVEDAMMLAKGYSAIKRTDGSMQLAYKGQPLYLWFKDEKPGDMTGDGVKGVWHIARP
ncbi:MAG: COG4315 family predicted lipoprotein [Brevirhabdus sp.]